MRVFLLFLFCLPSLFASETYIISGNTKTQSSYISKLAAECSHLQNENLEQCLLNSTLFSEVKVSKEGEKILIRVKDRWSIIPIPFFKADSEGKKTVGFYFLDLNFLGTGSRLGLGGAYSSSNASYFLFYKNPSIFFTKWSWGLSGSKGTKDIYLKDKNLKTLDAFKQKKSSLNLSVGYLFDNHFNVETNFGYKALSYLEKDGYSVPQNDHSLLCGLTFSWSNAQYKFYYNDGQSLSLHLMKDVYRSDETSKVHTAFLRYNFEKSFFRQEAFQFSFSALQTSAQDKRDLFKSGETPLLGDGYRGLPEGAFFTSTIFTSSIDYQIPLLFSGAGTWTIAPFFDYGFIRRYQKNDNDLFEQAYGIGTYYFFKGIILPRIGFVLGRNETFKTGFFSFSAGASL